MERHSLSDAAFAALGAGRPPAATIAELRRAQLSKHLLLLREIAKEDPDAWQASQHADHDGLRRRVADPLLGAWAADLLRSRHAAKTGRAQAGRAQHGAAAPPGSTSAAAEPPVPGDRWLTAEHGGKTIRVRLADADPARRLLGLTPTGRLTITGVKQWQRCLDDAWRILVDRHPAGAETLARVLVCLIPVKPEPAVRGISATSADAFGAVAMSAPGDGISLAVGLLHEIQHSLLNATTFLFDLLKNPRVLGYSPWRDDPRPASGILHGAYAYLAVTRFWRAEWAATGDRLAAFEFARWREATHAVADRLLSGADLTAGGPATAGRPATGDPATTGRPAAGGSGGQDTARLTAAGRRFVGALRDELEPWLDDPVDPEVRRLARVANADHYLRWRLRNLTVDPAGAERLAAAWNAGQDAPDVVPRLVPGRRRVLESSDRLDLIHGTLRGDPPPRPGGRATAADVALLRGDYGTAESAYRERVVIEPHDDAAWAGLALVTGGGDRLELTRAVALRTGADPVAIDRWIAR